MGEVISGNSGNLPEMKNVVVFHVDVTDGTNIALRYTDKDDDFWGMFRETLGYVCLRPLENTSSVFMETIAELNEVYPSYNFEWKHISFETIFEEYDNIISVYINSEGFLVANRYEGLGITETFNQRLNRYGN